MKTIGNALCLFITFIATACIEPAPPTPPDKPDAAMGPQCNNQKCEAGETPQTCPADCNTCGNGTCEANETATTCAADCNHCGDNVCQAGEATSCPGDCPASLRVQNNSSLYVYNLYAAKCGGSWTVDLTGQSYIPPGSAFTLTGIPPGCWHFRATTYNDVKYWQTQSTGVNLEANTMYTWTLTGS